jgi:hypothetical protein
MSGKSSICHGGEAEPLVGPVYIISIDGLVSLIKRLYIYRLMVLYVVLKYCHLEVHCFELPLVS